MKAFTPNTEFGGLLGMKRRGHFQMIQNRPYWEVRVRGSAAGLGGTGFGGFWAVLPQDQGGAR